MKDLKGREAWMKTPFFFGKPRRNNEEDHRENHCSNQPTAGAFLHRIQHGFLAQSNQGGSMANIPFQTWTWGRNLALAVLATQRQQTEQKKSHFALLREF